MVMYIYIFFVTFCNLPFNELSLVDYPLSFIAMTLLVGSSDP